MCWIIHLGAHAPAHIHTDSGFLGLWLWDDCPDACSGHGKCVNHKCECEENFIGRYDCGQLPFTIRVHVSLGCCHHTSAIAINHIVVVAN